MDVCLHSPFQGSRATLQVWPCALIRLPKSSQHQTMSIRKASAQSLSNPFHYRSQLALVFDPNFLPLATLPNRNTQKLFLRIKTDKVRANPIEHRILRMQDRFHAVPHLENSRVQGGSKINDIGPGSLMFQNLLNQGTRRRRDRNLDPRCFAQLEVFVFSHSDVVFTLVVLIDADYSDS